MIRLRSFAGTSPLMTSFVIPSSVKNLQTNCIVCLYGTKIISLCSVSSITYSSAFLRGAMSNSTTSLSSVYTAPPDNCNSLFKFVAAFTVVICSPAA